MSESAIVALITPDPPALGAGVVDRERAGGARVTLLDRSTLPGTNLGDKTSAKNADLLEVEATPLAAVDNMVEVRMWVRKARQSPMKACGPIPAIDLIFYRKFVFCLHFLRHISSSIKFGDVIGANVGLDKPDAIQRIGLSPVESYVHQRGVKVNPRASHEGLLKGTVASIRMIGA